MRVAVLDDVHDAWAATGGVRRLREHAEVRIFAGPFGDPSVLHGFDALVANRERTRFTRALLERLTGVRIIVQTGSHASHVDFAAARDCGIVIARASAGCSIGAAELALGLAIAVMRGIPSADRAVREGEWASPVTPVLHGKVMGIVGLGGVGRHAARLASAFGMRVLAWSPTLTGAAASEAGAARVELDDLLRQSDVVSIHASLTPASRGLIDRRRIAVMKATACLVNTARGPIVDEAALIDALARRRILGAGLDVFATEPLPAGHPLLGLPNVVLTPHIGWPTDEGYERFAAAACEVLLAYAAGRDVPRFDRHD